MPMCVVQMVTITKEASVGQEEEHCSVLLHSLGPHPVPSTARTDDSGTMDCDVPSLAYLGYFPSHMLFP